MPGGLRVREQRVKDQHINAVCGNDGENFWSWGTSTAVTLNLAFKKMDSLLQVMGGVPVWVTGCYHNSGFSDV